MDFSFKQTILVILITLSSAIPTFSQDSSIRVSGVIKDATTGEALIGATVVEKGTMNGTTSNFDGIYEIEVANSSSVLVVSFLGYL